MNSSTLQSVKISVCKIPSDYALFPRQVENSHPRLDVAQFSPRMGPILGVPGTMQPGVAACLEMFHESDKEVKMTCKFELHHRFSTPKRVFS